MFLSWLEIASQRSLQKEPLRFFFLAWAMSTSETASLPDESSSEKDSEAPYWEPMPVFSKIQVRIDGDMCVLTTNTFEGRPKRRLSDGTIVDAFRERHVLNRCLLKHFSTDELMWELMWRECVGDEEDSEMPSLASSTRTN